MAKSALRSIATAAAVFAGVALLNCSFIIDKDSAQCATTADCTAKGPDFKGLICGPQGVCVKEGGCGSNQECISANGGAPFICRKEDRTCVPLSTNECKPLAADPGDPANDNTIWLGFISSMTGEDSGFGRSLLAAVEIARKELRDVAAGLPPRQLGGPRRPIAFVVCDEALDVNVAAKYLVNDLRVPAIMGPGFSSDTLKVVPDTVNKGTLVISPSAGSPLLSKVPSENPRLLFRTAPSAAYEAEVLVEYIKTSLEAKVRKAYAIPAGTPIKLAVAYRGDVIGTTETELFQKDAVINGKSVNDASNAANYLAVSYGDPEDPANTNPMAQYASAAAKINAFQPNIIVMIGAEEGANLMTIFEKDWPAGPTYRPWYMLTSAVAVSVNLDVQTDFLKRFTITQEGNAEAASFVKFKKLYDTNVTDVAFDPFAPNAYDATYVLAYAISSLGDKPATSANIADAIKNLLSGPQVPVGRDSIFDALNYVTKGQSIDLVGASGPLDFDLKTGDVSSDYTIACAKNNPLRVDPSGVVFNATKKVFEGTRSADCIPEL